MNQPQPGATLNTRYGIGKNLTMNRDEVEEDPSEDESTDTFESKGTEAFEKEGIESFPSEVNYEAKTYQGQGFSFEHFLQKLTRL